ncbi:hypothetical protein Cob_v011164 [Colletotrichum orbiculare MAFF 240422]|uniref:Uncharacterized protein n=1 Tax=Colletotrichum orbiculare (strain 104-T / ATCC 96160 / CBS 514.97 / LARS 414 / MAFF 240422) TaxID=1213857 RepID=A0A484FBY5_COLOR|nr:hypothetical protein Cob_v011164 [Colletotrichum orbiculare MAFF 240422]
MKFYIITFVMLISMACAKIWDGCICRKGIGQPASDDLQRLACHRAAPTFRTGPSFQLQHYRWLNYNGLWCWARESRTLTGEYFHNACKYYSVTDSCCVELDATGTAVVDHSKGCG